MLALLASLGEEASHRRGQAGRRSPRGRRTPLNAAGLLEPTYKGLEKERRNEHGGPEQAGRAPS